MNERIATCTSCGARYGNIPDTLTAKRIRCRKCSGVVEIPPLVEPAEAPEKKLRTSRSAAPVDRTVAKAKPPASKKATPTPKPTPPQKPETPPKPSGAEILARIQARKAAAAPTPQSTPPKETEESKTESAAEPSESPSKSASEPASSRRQRPDRKRTTSRKRRSARSRPSARKSPRGAKDEDAQEKKGLPVLGLVSVAVIVVGGFVAFFLTRGGNDPENTTSADAGAATSMTSETPDTKQGAEVSGSQPAPNVATTAPNEATTAPNLVAAAVAPPVKEDEETPNTPALASSDEEKPLPPSRDFLPPEAGETIDYSGITDPTFLDLSSVPALPRWTGSDESTWQEIQDDLELYLEDGGARSNRAGTRLVESGRHAFPAMVNAMLKTQWEDPDSVRTCGALNKLIVRMSKAGKNFGWETLALKDPASTEYAKSLLWDKKVVAIWYNSWLSKFSVDEDQWQGFAEKKTKPKPKADEQITPPSIDDEFDD